MFDTIIRTTRVTTTGLESLTTQVVVFSIIKTERDRLRLIQEVVMDRIVQDQEVVQLHKEATSVDNPITLTKDREV